MKFLKNLYALFLMISSLKFFNPETEFKGKRVAIIGAADSAFEEKNGDYIDSFDVVVRINKAPHYWSEKKAGYIGKKFTYLFHSYYENQYSGGGPVDWDLYDKLGVKKVVNPNNSLRGLNAHLSYYKRNSGKRATYILSKKNHKIITKKMKGFVPTVGYSALKAVLLSECKEVYISGFTFFKTPYAKDYRKELENPEINKQHIINQGIHNPELEFENFKTDLKATRCKKVCLDRGLAALLGSPGAFKEKDSSFLVED